MLLSFLLVELISQELFHEVQLLLCQVERESPVVKHSTENFIDNVLLVLPGVKRYSAEVLGETQSKGSEKGGAVAFIKRNVWVAIGFEDFGTGSLAEGA